MSEQRRVRRTLSAAGQPPGRLLIMASVEIVLPVYNEERVLAESVGKLHAYMSANVFHDWRITIADNGSRDGTLEIAEKLSSDLPTFPCSMCRKRAGPCPDASLAEQRRRCPGLMDIDLSTGSNRCRRCSTPSRRDAPTSPPVRGSGPGARTNRSFKREVLSRGYVFMINAAFRGVRLRDTQCGFKAISRECARPSCRWCRRRLVLGHGATAAGGQGRLEGPLRSGGLARGHGQPRQNRQHGKQGHQGPLAHAGGSTGAVPAVLKWRILMPPLKGHRMGHLGTQEHRRHHLEG